MSASDVQPMAVDVPAALALRPDQLASVLPSHHLLPLREALEKACSSMRLAAAHDAPVPFTDASVHVLSALGAEIDVIVPASSCPGLLLAVAPRVARQFVVLLSSKVSLVDEALMLRMEALVAGMEVRGQPAATADLSTIGSFASPAIVYRRTNKTKQRPG